MIRGLAGRTLFAAVFAGLAAIGHWMLFANFALYDDEGYIMMSAREYFAHGGLYELVYSQYGPAFYAAMDAVQHVLRAPIDHTTARWLTLGAWLGTALACAALVWRETTSRALGLFTLAATFLFLYFLPDEPFHPGSFIVLLLALSTWLLSETIGAGKWSAAAALAGGTGAVLLLTKINVGVFFLAAISAWALGHIAPARGRRAAPLVTCIALPLLAAAVMHTLIRETWIHIYLAVFSVGAITLALSWRGEAIFTNRHCGVFVAAGTLTGVIILTAIWLRGTSLVGLLHGVLLGPLQHPGSYSYPVDWRPGTLPLAVTSLVLAIAVPWLRRWHSDESADRLIVALRLLQTAVLLVGLCLLMHGRVIGAVFSYVAPLLWIWVVPLSGTTDAQRQSSQPDTYGDGSCSRGRRPRPVRQRLGDGGTGLSPSTRLGAGEAGYIPPSGKCDQRQTARRALLATILLLQYLHAYPVGGSQESWGTFLFLPLVALGLGDLRRRWPEPLTRRGSPGRADFVGASRDIVALPSLPRPVGAGQTDISLNIDVMPVKYPGWQPPRPMWTWLAAPLVIALLAKVAWVATETRNKHATRIDLGLPGASSLRLEENLRTAYRVLALNASVHADGLFSLPGMFSFNLWTGLPSPTTRNTTLWFTLLSEDEQRATIAGIERAPRTCIIVQETLVQLMQAGQVPIRGPLRDYIYEKFSLAFRVEGFAFLVRTGRTIAPLGIARVSALPPADRSAPQFDSRLDFTIAGDGTPITSVAVSTNRPPLAPTARLDATNAAYVTTAIDRAGNALRPPQTATWPIVCTGLTRVSLTFQRGTPAAAIAAGRTLYLQDRDGQTRHEVRVVAEP